MARSEVALNLRPEYVQQPPVFEAGTIRISYISDSPRGMQFHTEGKLRREQLRQPGRNFHDIVPRNSDLWNELSSSLRNDADYALRTAIGPIPTTLASGDHAYDEAVNSIRTHQDEVLKKYMPPEEYDAYIAERSKKEALRARHIRIENMTMDERIMYMNTYAKTNKLAIRFPWFDPQTDTLHAYISSIPFWIYKKLADPRMGPEAVNIAANAACTLNLITSDGKVIKQTRGKSNSKFQRDLGNSASGMTDIRFNHGEKGHPQSENDGSIISGNIKEIGEEIGVKADHITSDTVTPEQEKTILGIEDVTTENILEAAEGLLLRETVEIDQGTGKKKIILSDFKILGVAEDPLSPHDEFCAVARINLTAQEVFDLSRKARRHSKKNDRDFAEHYIVMDATPEAFARLLSNPDFQDSPPTHASDDLLTGRYLMMEREGVDAANAWMHSLKAPIDAAWEESKRRKQEFLRQNPHILEQYPDMDQYQYDPNYDDVTNGFKPLEERIANSGIESDINKVYDTAYMFDCDGVLTGLKERKLRFPEILDGLIDILGNGTLSLCSGRSGRWIVEQLVEPMVERIQTQQKSMNLLDNLYIIGESGGVLIDIDKRGNVKKFVDTAHAVPTNIKNIVRALVAGTYSQDMFLDEDKEVIVTVEQALGADLADFKDAQKKLYAELQIMLRPFLEDGTYTLDMTGIATDIKHRDVDKFAAAHSYLDWMRGKGITAKSFVVMGDSKSDTLMAKAIAEDGRQVFYKNVGPEEIKQDEFEFPVSNMVITHDEITRDHLRILRRNAS